MRRQIISYILLIAYSFVITHQSVLHSHDEDVTHHSHAHTHDNHHTHSHTSDFDLLHLLEHLFSTHVHASDVEGDYVSTDEASFNIDNNERLSKSIILPVLWQDKDDSKSNRFHIIEGYKPVYRASFSLKELFGLFTSLRGPPFLA